MPAERDTFRRGRITAKLTKIRPTQNATLGLQPLGLDANKDGLLYIPLSYQADKPTPLVVLLYGAGGYAQHGLSILQHLADASNLIILAPPSRQSSWDIIDEERFGSDIIFIDEALSK